MRIDIEACRLQSRNGLDTHVCVAVNDEDYFLENKCLICYVLDHKLARQIFHLESTLVVKF